MPKRHSGRRPVSDDQLREVIAAARTAYHAKGGLPSLDEINAVCSVSRGKIAQAIATEEFFAAMRVSGINWRKHKGLSARQHFALAMMSDPADRRHFDTRLKEAGITPTEWKSWNNNPIFAGLVEGLMGKAVENHRLVADQGLMKAVANGDLRAIEFYYKFTGVYNDKSPQERDLGAVMSQVIDILQRNVTDREQLAAIAEEFSNLTGNKKQLTAYRAEQVPDINIVDAEEVPQPVNKPVDKISPEDLQPPVRRFNLSDE